MATPGAFADHLKQAAATHYGHALTAFVTELVKIREGSRNTCAKAGTPSPANCVVNIEDGQIRRVAQRFAIVAAAGNWPPLSADRLGTGRS